MVDRRHIVDLWHRRSAQVLVTLVRIEGSSYRRPGAHLLIGNGSEYAGTISGGCLEAEVVRKASWFVASGPIPPRMPIVRGLFIGRSPRAAPRSHLSGIY